jgi:hypothetical protein
MLSVLIALAMAGTLFVRLRRSCGVLAACAAPAVFLSLPRIQWSAWEVMSDLLTGFFVLLAVLSFSDFLQKPERRRSIWNFAMWSAAAILTKGNAFALAPFAVLAPLLAWRPRRFGSVSYWAAGIACAIVSLPFYVFVARAGFGYSTAPPTTGGDPNFSRLSILAMLWRAAPPLVLAAVAIGFAAAAYRRWHDADEGPATTDALTAGACILAQVLFLMVFPLSQEPRVFVPSLAPAALLFGYCVYWMQSVLRPRPALATAVPAALAGLSIAIWGLAWVPHVEGYWPAVDAIPYRQEGSLILVSGSAICEGHLIVDRLTHNRWRSDVMLRASHALAESTWGGHHYSALLPDADSVRKYLMDLPVRYILLDDTASTPYGELLAGAIAGSPRDFAELGQFPIHSMGRLIGAVHVYENLAAGGRRPAVVRVPLGLERGARVLEYRWK